MDVHAVPFPTTPHHPEDPAVPFAPDRPQVPPRLHSTPSLPNLGLPHSYAPPSSLFLPQGSARHRPHLRPLDLASSPSSSPTKRDPSFGLLRRPPTLLTPPLTPSSSFNSNANDTPSTPPEPRSPLRWVNSPDRERTFAAAHSAYSSGLKSLMSASSTLGGGNAGYLTPTSARSQSLSSDEGTGFSSGLSTAPEISALASGLASTEITPRDERTLVLKEQDDSVVLELDIGDAPVEAGARLLVVRRVPPTAPSSALLETFSSMGDVKGILARFQATHGVIILAFFDTRHAARALKHISGNTFATLNNARLEAAFVAPADIEKLTGTRSEFISELDGSFYVTVEGLSMAPRDVQQIFATFGELASFTAAGSDPCDQTFHVEFCDCRDAVTAHKSLNNRTIFGARMSLVSDKDALDHRVRLMQSGARSSSPDAAQPRDGEGRSRPRSVSASEGVGTPDAVRRLRKAKEPSQDHGRRSSNDLFFDAVGKHLDPTHSATSRPRSVSANAEEPAPAVKMQPPVGGYFIPAGPYPYPDATYGYVHPSGGPAMYGAQPPPYAYSMYAPDMNHVYSDHAGGTAKLYWTYATPPPAPADYYLPAGGRSVVNVPFTGPTPSHRVYPSRPPPDVGLDDVPHFTFPFSDDQSRAFSTGERPSDASHGSQRVPSSKNALDIANIENGVDTRTTVMIKNIPNKMSDRDLLNFINRVCPRRIDFMYLRMDFQNGCNVGYAFVNFITVQDLLHFARTQLGVKWNMYSSEKVLQMCYATYQGKESLVEKFKNSCIMDEREAWRPKIFFSDGVNQGLPEPFPPPTHLRRKERSQNNRGALFVPGTHHQPSSGGNGRGAGGGLYHHRPNPPRMSTR
ncbi:RNA recognition motif 2-domain-containing protein [Trametes meyenii]|nr:RNA recognition motif 2-domain-containing protein [Trametes meyenii]